ncbi:MAG: hypothetical protein V2B14_00615 [bacterium]
MLENSKKFILFTVGFVMVIIMVSGFISNKPDYIYCPITKESFNINKASKLNCEDRLLKIKENSSLIKVIDIAEKNKKRFTQGY